MPRKKPAIGKRELKRMTRDAIKNELLSHGLETQDMKAGSITYTVARFNGEPNQIVAAIYGSIKGCASIWMKESAFELVKPSLSDDAIVEDVAMFRRGFQWAVHFESPDQALISKCVEAAVQSGHARLSKTLTRRADDERRASERKTRQAKMAEKKRDWKADSSDNK